MQAAKDSFYIALRDRLVTVDPQRTMALDGATRPAIAVAENEPPNAGPPQCDAFYLHWGNVRPVQPAVSTLMAGDCAIAYRTRGTDANASLDRGRALAALDNDLLAICAPPQTAKNDYSTGTPVPLGSTIFWTAPSLSGLVNAGPYIGREAAVTVFFYPEVNQP